MYNNQEDNTKFNSLDILTTELPKPPTNSIIHSPFRLSTKYSEDKYHLKIPEIKTTVEKEEKSPLYIPLRKKEELGHFGNKEIEFIESVEEEVQPQYQKYQNRFNQGPSFYP